MATSMDSILEYLPRLLPEIKVPPLPEIVFLSTIKALVVPAASLSLPQWGTLGLLLLLTNTLPAPRKATAKLYGYLSLIIGAEIAMINAYVLFCSWISPSTTLQPVTVVTLNVLNSLVPVYTDSLLLIHLIKEKASQSHSKVNLVSTMGTPVLLKCMRLASAVMSIHASTEFIITSLTVGKGDNPPGDVDIIETARKWGVYMSSSLQLVDNLYSLAVHWMHAIKMRKLTAAMPSPTASTSLSGLVLSLGSQYVLPIALNAAQLAASSYIPSGNAAMLIDSAKVVINVASASVTTLRKVTDPPQGQSALLKKSGDVSPRDMPKIPVPPVPIPDAGGATAPAYTPMSTVGAPAGGDPKDSAPDPDVSPAAPQLNDGHHIPASPGSS